MVLCIIAFIVFSVLSIFSVSYRALAKEAFKCVFLKLTLRPCETGLDQKIRAKILSQLYNVRPGFAQFAGKYYELLSWIFVILSIASAIILAQGVYNIYLYGTCDPVHPEQCLVTGVFGAQPICPNSFDGINVGPANAKVLIIEFGCFTCPYTKNSEDILQNILQKYNGSVRYVFKTFPIPTHNYSQEAAFASVCANNQGKYWEYRKVLFENQSAISKGGVPYLLVLASNVGMNTSQFSSCLSDNATSMQVSLMQEEGLQSNVRGTPTFFVNHKYVPKVEDLEKIVQEELKK